MKKGIKLAALAALVWAVLSCGQGVTAGGNVVPSSNEDEAVFTGNGFVFSYDKATGKEKKVYHLFRNIRVVFRKDGTFTIGGERHNPDTNRWFDTIPETQNYKISDTMLHFLGTDCKYSYRGNTLIIKMIERSSKGGWIFILSSAHHASFLPQTDFTLSIPSE